MSTTLVIHLFATFFMTGLCWFVQIAHYPLFHQIKMAEFPEYERKNFVTGYITIPVMIIELGSGLLLLYMTFDSLFFINVILLGIIGLSTVIFQVPIHLKLTKEASYELINRLIKTNWIRTISWTLRSVLLSYVLINML